MVDQIQTAGGSACAFAADVFDKAGMQKLVDRAQAEYGGLHPAVNNAGIGGPSYLVGDYPSGDWRRVIDVSLNGVFYGRRWQIPAMLCAGGGAIVNMSSILGPVGFANAASCVAARHALMGLTRTAAVAYASQGVRVNAAGLAFIATPAVSQPLVRGDGWAVPLHPMGRIGRPEEVSALVCLLLSDRASFITGSYHLVDGSYTAP